MIERKDLAGFLQSARQAAGLTQVACARAAGVSTSYLRAIEQGQRVPAGNAVARIAGALGADPVLALALHEAIQAADNRAKCQRLLALADAGDPEGTAFVLQCFGRICDQAGEERLKSAVAGLPEGYTAGDLAQAVLVAWKEGRRNA